MNKLEQKKKIAVVGAGVSGISSLYGILNAHKNLPVDCENLQIDIFEAQDVGGYQYLAGPTSLEHAINMDMNAMTVGGVDPCEWICKHKDHITKFLKTNFPSHHLLGKSLDLINNISPEDKFVYIPRVVYGLYLKNVYNSIVSQLKSRGIEVNEHKSQVTDIQQQPINDTIATDKKYDSIIYSGGHQIKTHSSNISSSKIEAYPASQVYEKLDNILLEKVKSGITPIEIDVKVLGTSLSGIDSVFSINSWVENGKIKNPELFKNVKVNLTLSSRSLNFPTARITEMPKNPVNDEIMMSLCRKAYKSLRISNATTFEKQMLNLYVDIVNTYRTNLGKEHGINLQPLTFDEIFNSDQQKCENASEIKAKTLHNISRATDKNDLEYLLNQACFRMSSKYGTYLFGKLTKHNLGQAYRTAYVNNVTAVPVVTLKRLLNALDNPNIQTSVRSELKSHIGNYDITLDASGGVKKISEHGGVIDSLLSSDKITKGGVSKVKGLLSPGNNKITTAFVGGSAKEGKNAGHIAMLNMVSSHLQDGKNKTSWFNDVDGKVPQSKLPTSNFADTTTFSQKTVGDTVTKLHYTNKVKDGLGHGMAKL